jgi:predicted O-methyltransferase YrrM
MPPFVNLGWSRAGAPAMWSVLDEATRVAERHLADPAAWWESMGHAAQVPEQVASFRGLLASEAELRSGRVCEIGFNAGHSAVMWLHGTRAHLVEFDLQSLPYSAASRSFVERSFPGRVHFHVGKSRQTVASYAAAVHNGSAPPCDLWLVDGDHGIGAKDDMLNALAASRAGTVVVVDDASLRFPLLRKYWRIHVAIGSIRELACVQLSRRGVTHTAKGWCIGRVQPWATTAAGRARLGAEFATLVSRARRDEVLRRYGRASNGSFAVDPRDTASVRSLYRGLGGVAVPGDA